MFKQIYSHLICFVFLSTSTFAWADFGHMVTAQVAKLHLKQNQPAVLEWAQQLVEFYNTETDGRSNTFIEASVWADDIKQEYSFRNSWHYTDHPIKSNGFVTFDDLTTPINSVDAMNKARSAMTNRSTIQTDHTELKAEMLRFILHVIGDMHQPLHNADFYNSSFSKGDHGGNIMMMKNIDGSLISLHQFWDLGAYILQPSYINIDRPLSYSSIKAMEQYAQNQMINFPLSSFADRDMKSPKIWTEDGHQQAIQIAYPFTVKNSQITEEYQDLVYALVQNNIILGGYRLAAFLTDIYLEIQTIKESKQASYIYGILSSIKKQNNKTFEGTQQIPTQQLKISRIDDILDSHKKQNDQIKQNTQISTKQQQVDHINGILDFIQNRDKNKIQIVTQISPEQQRVNYIDEILDSIQKKRHQIAPQTVIKA